MLCVECAIRLLRQVLLGFNTLIDMAHRIMHRQSSIDSAHLAGGLDDIAAVDTDTSAGLSGDDVWVVVADWQLNKIMWLINCFCSWKKSSQDKVMHGNIYQI